MDKMKLSAFVLALATVTPILAIAGSVTINGTRYTCTNSCNVTTTSTGYTVTDCCGGRVKFQIQ